MEKNNNEVVKDSVKILIARVAHQANRAIKEFYGEDNLPSWDESSKESKSRGVLGVEKVIANRNITNAEIHQAWVDTMLADGWRHGPVIDTIKKFHPNLVAYEDLSDNQKLKDVVYLAIVKAFLDC